MSIPERLTRPQLPSDHSHDDQAYQEEEPIGWIVHHHEALRGPR